MYESENKFIIWGAGTRGRKLLRNCTQIGIKIMAFVDSDTSLEGICVQGIPVLSPENYLRNHEKSNVFLISPVYYESVLIQLAQMGIDRYILYRDIMLLDFDNGAWTTDCLARNNTESDKGWIDEYSRLLKFFRDSHLGILESSWRKDLEYHEFSKKQKLVPLQEVLSKIHQAKYPMVDNEPENIIAATRLLCGNRLIVQSGTLPVDNSEFDLLLIHGLSLNTLTHCLLIEARDKNVPVVFQEDGFLRSIVPFEFKEKDDIFRRPHSLTLQEHGIYINAHQPSYIEQILQSDWELDESERIRARKCIERIRTERLSKYNHQPLACPNLRQKGQKNVLVIDQVYGDKSIVYGLACEDTFEEMLHTAIRENPHDNIFVKTHPASDFGHYGTLRDDGKIHILRDPVNPISLLEQMDKVYVCVSTMGFEALICECEVHVFGMPFYAGWGITIDKLNMSRRSKKRSLEEVFYVAYILASTYVSYETEGQCEIEQAMDELLALRTKYFKIG